MSMYEEMVMDDPERLQRYAMLLAWRTLRQSVAHGRPMSLPNLLRLHRRLSWHHAQHASGATRPARPQWAVTEAAIRSGYLAAQPFDPPALPPLPPN